MSMGILMEGNTPHILPLSGTRWWNGGCSWSYERPCCVDTPPLLHHSIHHKPSIYPSIIPIILPSPIRLYRFYRSLLDACNLTPSIIGNIWIKFTKFCHHIILQIGDLSPICNFFQRLHIRYTKGSHVFRRKDLAKEVAQPETTLEK